jgi:hypothetical protein
MAYALTTYSALKGLLKKRVGSNGTFWSEFEYGMAVNEALNVWQLLTGEFSSQGKVAPSDISSEFYSLYNPSSGAMTMVLPGTSTAAPLPLSVWRIGTDVTTNTTGALNSFAKLVQASLPELDYGYTNWRTGTAATPEYWVPNGLNQVVFYPRPSTHVRVDYYRGTQLLVAETDAVQLGDEELNRILDYAVWQLNIKAGTEEAFGTTGPLRELFLLAAQLRNSKLRGSQLYKDFLGGDRGEVQPDRNANAQNGAR